MTRESLRRLLRSQTLRLAATVVLLGLIIWRIQPQNLAASFDKLQPTSVAVAALLTLPFLYLKTLRWLYMLRNAGSEATFGEAAVSLVGGMGLALVTPARVGEVARIAYLRDPRKLRLSALVMLDKFFDVLVLALLAIVGAWRLLGWPAGVGLSAIGVAGLVFTFFPRLFASPVAYVERRAPLKGRTHEVFSSLESLSPAATALYISLTVAAFALVILQFALILHGSANVSPGIAPADISARDPDQCRAADHRRTRNSRGGRGGSVGALPRQQLPGGCLGIHYVLPEHRRAGFRGCHDPAVPAGRGGTDKHRDAETR